MRPEPLPAAPPLALVHRPPHPLPSGCLRVRSSPSSSALGGTRVSAAADSRCTPVSTASSLGWGARQAGAAPADDLPSSEHPPDTSPCWRARRSRHLRRSVRTCCALLIRECLARYAFLNAPRDRRTRERGSKMRKRPKESKHGVCLYPITKPGNPRDLPSCEPRAPARHRAVPSNESFSPAAPAAATPRSAVGFAVVSSPLSQERSSRVATASTAILAILPFCHKPAFYERRRLLPHPRPRSRRRLPL